jgi:hypothetical protein
MRELVHATRLERVFPDSFDAARFSMFQWLVVEEEVDLDPRPAARANHWFFETTLDHDHGQLEPHKGRFPLVVENALFALLLAPWEEWSTVPMDWRGFRVPWVYTVTEDVFVRPEPPRSADTLAWDHHFYDDGYGGVVEGEAPTEWPLNDAAQSQLAALDTAHWSVVEKALGSPLFETPVRHFFVRAFLSEGIDEFLAHLTTIEAALGLHADYEEKLRPRPDPHGKLGASRRLRARIAAHLSDCSAAELYRTLFDVRSCYLHGRRMEETISSEKKTGARRLARRVVEELVSRANEVSALSTREEFLRNLLDRGARMLKAPPAGRA